MHSDPRSPRSRSILLSVLAASAAFLATIAGGAQPSGTEPDTQPATPEVGEDAQLLENIAQAEEFMIRFGLKDAPPKPAGTFRLTSYNIQNLFDDVDDPTLSGRDEDIDDAKPYHEMLVAARAIRELDADVLCLQEIESRQALDWFVERYIPDMGYEYIISLDAGNSRGIENAVLSRYPLNNPELWVGKLLGGVHPDNYGPNAENWYAGEPIAFRRSPLKVDVEIPAGDERGDAWTMTLFVVHHKSGRYNQYWREAEAKTIAELAQQVEQEHPGRAIAILGDFNAEPGDESVKTYLRNGFHDIFADSKRRGDQIITHESDRRIDLILGNEAAMDRFREQDAFVLGTPARSAEVDWRDLETFEGYASDHYPVSVDVEITD